MAEHGVDRRVMRSVNTLAAFIREHEQEFRIVVMCRVLGVSTSGYYGWCKRGPSQQAQRRAVLELLKTF